MEKEAISILERVSLAQTTYILHKQKNEINK